MMHIRISVETNGEKFNFEIGKKYHITTFEDLGYQERRTHYTNVIVNGVNSHSIDVTSTDKNRQLGPYPKIMLNELESVEEVEE